MTIRLRPVIAWLGASLGVVVAAPGVIGCIVLACRPSDILQYPAGAAFCCGQVVGFGWLTYRWLTVRGTADARELHLRGWFKTLVVPTADVAGIRHVETESDSSRRSYDVLYDHEAGELGTIPGVLAICPGWKPFLAHVRRLVAASRSRGPAAAEPRRMEDIPVSEWTLEDIERYERRG